MKTYKLLLPAMLAGFLFSGCAGLTLPSAPGNFSARYGAFEFGVGYKPTGSTGSTATQLPNDGGLAK